jgi:hypothetical protein
MLSLPDFLPGVGCVRIYEKTGVAWLRKRGKGFSVMIDRMKRI